MKVDDSLIVGNYEMDKFVAASKSDTTNASGFLRLYKNNIFHGKTEVKIKASTGHGK